MLRACETALRRFEQSAQGQGLPCPYSRRAAGSVNQFRTIPDILPVIRQEWIDQDLHHRAIAALLTARRRDLSLVDCTSFELMRRLGIRVAFAFDRHFAEQGFEMLALDRLPERQHSA